MPPKAHRHRTDLARIQNARWHSDKQPISRIPAEILAHIFLIHRQSFFTTVSSIGSTEFSSSFKHEMAFSFAAVCQAWRNIAMNYPQLWSIVDFRYYPVQMCMEMVKRAKACPLDVVICLPWCYKEYPNRLFRAEKYDPELLVAITPLVPRMQGVHWGLGLWLVPKFLEKLFRLQRENPLLRTLEIWQFDLYRSSLERMPFAFSSDLLVSASPSSFENTGFVRFRSLSSLQLLGAPVDWDAIPDSMCNDSVVKLVYQPDRLTLPSAVQLARFISKFSALRDLDLRTHKFENVFESSSKIVGSSVSPHGKNEISFPLNNLQRISATHGHSSLILPLFQHLVLPETVSWDITCTYVSDEDSVGMSGVLDMITSRVSFPHVKLCRNGNSGTVALTGSFPYSSTPTLSLQLHASINKKELNCRIFRRAFDELASSYPIDAMKSFEYDYAVKENEVASIPDDAEDIECTKWRTLLQRQGGTLEELTVVSFFGLNCALKVLAADGEQVKIGSKEATKDTVLAPNMRRFVAKVPLPSSEDAGEPEEQVVLHLLEGWAKQRKKAAGNNDELVVAIVPSERVILCDSDQDSSDSETLPTSSEH